MNVSTKPINDYPWFIRLFFWNQKRRYGQVLDPGMLWGRSPWVFAAVALLYGALDRKSSPLEPSLRSLLLVRISQLNHCTFCTDINTATLLKRGVSLEKAAELAQWSTCDLFSKREKLALEYAETVTVTGRKVDHVFMQELKKEFDEDVVVELTAVISFQNLSTKFNNAMDVPTQGFCSIPGKNSSAPAGD